MPLMVLSFLFFMLFPLNSFSQVNISTSGTPSTIYLGSPSLVNTAGGDIIVSHDFYGPGSPTNGSGRLYRSEIFSSSDDGLNWSSLGTVDDMYWSSIFEYSGSLYTIGFANQYGNVVIRKSSDYGTTWGSNTVLDTTTYPHSAGGQPPVIHDGKLWFSYEISTSATFNANSNVKLAWVDLSSDIMNSANWNFSSEISFPSELVGENWLYVNYWSESSVFVAPDNTLKIIAKINSDPDSRGFAALIDVNASTGALTFNSVVNLPGGDKKFQIQVSNGRIWTITNPNIYPVGKYGTAESRNVVELYSSVDGIYWQRHKRLIDQSSLDPTQYGVQYTSFAFDGSDLIMATRTADINADDAHNANKIDFYRFTDWQQGWDGVGL